MKSIFKEKVRKYVDDNKEKIKCVTVTLISEDGNKEIFGTLWVHVKGKYLPKNFDIKSKQELEFAIKILSEYAKEKRFENA